MKKELRDLVQQSTPDAVAPGAHREALWQRIEARYGEERVQPWSPPAYAAALAAVVLLMVMSLSASHESTMARLLAAYRQEFCEVMPAGGAGGAVIVPVREDRVPYTAEQLKLIRNSAPPRVTEKWVEGFIGEDLRLGNGER